MSRDTGAVYDAHLVRRLWSYVRPHQRLIWISLLLLILTSVSRLALPYIFKIAIDDHLTTGDIAGLTQWIWIFALIAMIEVVGTGIENWTVDMAGQNALLDLRMHVFSHLQKLSASFYDRTPIGRLVGRVTTDIQALQEMFSSGVVTILGDFFFLIATVIILFTMSWQLTLITLLVVPGLVAITMWIRIRARRAYVDIITRRSRLNAFLHEHVTGMPILQSFVREDSAADGFRETNAGMRHAQLSSVLWESTLSALTELLGSLTFALILWYGGGLIVGRLGGDLPSAAWQQALTLGALFAFMDYMQRFFVPLNDLSMKYTVMQNAMTASERIFALLDETEITPEPPHPVVPGPTRGAIEFRDVTFGYDPDEPVVHDLSFTVAPGERVAIVGATGAGKTTILKILTRLYDIQSGAILLDGTDIRELGLRDLRQRVGIVPQDVFLFEGDILGNIRLGHPDITPEQAAAAADQLRLDQVVSRFPRGYHEPVRERGGNLSSGERQLIAFARVLAVAPPVLALDEATSNVDTATEQLLQEAVGTLMEKRTSLIIAHRLSTIRDVDRILVMHRGRLAESGSHEELLERRGLYHSLYEHQYRDRDDAGSDVAGASLPGASD